jgi:hypothetical protein
MEDWTDLFKDRKKQELGKYIPENKKFADKTELSEDHDKEEYQRLLLKKFNKLKHKLTYLNLEHEDCSDVLKIAKENFISCMFNYCSENELEAPFSKVKDEKKMQQDTLTTEEEKELYRQILMSTHPDKLKGLSEKDIEEKTRLYQEAVKGKEEGDFNKILKVALELEIDFKKINPDIVRRIEEEINSLDKKIKNIKDDLMWKWYYCNKAQQEEIFRQLTSN